MSEKRKPFGGRQAAMPVKPGMEKIAKQLTHAARTRLRRIRVPDTQVARAAGVNRMAVWNFRNGEPRDDMSLKMFLAVMNETGGDPAAALGRSLAGVDAEPRQ